MASSLAPHRQRLQGYVVGFSGASLFYLGAHAVASLEVPHSEPMLQHLERGMHAHAFQVACLGVTTKDWHTLALSALEAHKLDVARKAFTRTRDFKYLNLIAQFQVSRFSLWSYGNIINPDFHLHAHVHGDFECKYLLK